MRYNWIAVYAGAFSGIGAALWTLFEFMMGWHTEHLETGQMTGFIAIIFPIVAIVWALRASKRLNNGRLTVRQSILCGIKASAISAAIGVAFFYAYYHSINPGFIEAMKARGQTVDIGAQLVTVVIGSFVLGVFISTIAGFIMRTSGGAEYER
jgi:hypothetical protein